MTLDEYKTCQRILTSRASSEESRMKAIADLLNAVEETFNSQRNINIMLHENHVADVVGNLIKIRPMNWERVYYAWHTFTDEGASDSAREACRKEIEEVLDDVGKASNE